MLSLRHSHSWAENVILRICNSKIHSPLTLYAQEQSTVLLNNLPKKLQIIVENLRQVPDDKLRYQQLLFMGAKASPMSPELKIDSNKVQGCLSTVFVHATMDESSKIQFIGDSDAMLTKGLVVMLVEGLSG